MVMERGKHKIEVVQQLGEVTSKGRTYKVLKQRDVETDEKYITIEFYDDRGCLTNNFMIEAEVVGEIAQILLDNAEVIPVQELLRRFPSLRLLEQRSQQPKKAIAK